MIKIFIHFLALTFILLIPPPAAGNTSGLSALKSLWSGSCGQYMDFYKDEHGKLEYIQYDGCVCYYNSQNKIILLHFGDEQSLWININGKNKKLKRVEPTFLDKRPKIYIGKKNLRKYRRRKMELTIEYVVDNECLFEKNKDCSDFKSKASITLETAQFHDQINAIGEFHCAFGRPI